MASDCFTNPSQLSDVLSAEETLFHSAVFVHGDDDREGEGGLAGREALGRTGEARTWLLQAQK